MKVSVTCHLCGKEFVAEKFDMIREELSTHLERHSSPSAIDPEGGDET